MGFPPSAGAPDRSAPVLESSVGDEAKGKEVTEDATSLKPMPLKESGTVQANTAGPSRSFHWMPELGPILDEIWSEESFRQLFEEPLQANNRDGVRLLAKVRYDESLS